MADETGTENGTAGQTDCTTCPRPDKEAINAALLARVPLREIVSRHAGTSRSSLSRHRRKCVAGAIVRAVARAAPAPDNREIEIFEDTLLGEMRALQSRTMRLLEDAEASPDLRLRALVVGQVRENIAALAKLMPTRGQEEVVEISFSFTDPPRLLSQGRGAAIAADVEGAQEEPDVEVVPSSVEVPENIGTEPEPFSEPLNLTYRTFDGKGWRP